MSRFLFAFLPLLSMVFAQRPSDTPICDYYAAKILGNNTETNQKLLLTLLTNGFVVGNYTTPNTGVALPGFAAPAVYNGTEVTLLPYFTGALNSTNDGGDMGVSRLILDDGGPVPLLKNMSSNGNVDSAQDYLLNHIYQYFGTLLGCTLQGGNSFPSYSGNTNMFAVHKFMDLDKFQMDFFISQVGLSAASIGFDPDDITIYTNTLNRLFNTRCAAPTAVPGIKAAPEQQSICIAENCDLDPKADCAAYPNNGLGIAPVNVTAAANSTMVSSNNSVAASGIATSVGHLAVEATGLAMLGLMLEFVMLVAVSF